MEREQTEFAMNRQDQIGLLKRLLNYVDTNTTAMADAPWNNDVSVYTDAEHLARERQMLFRRYPILGVGLARRLPHRRLCRRTGPDRARA